MWVQIKIYFLYFSIKLFFFNFPNKEKLSKNFLGNTRQTTERRQILSSKQPSAAPRWRRRAPRTRHLDRKIRLPPVSPGVQRGSGERLALPLLVLLERRWGLSDPLHGDADNRRAPSDVHGTVTGAVRELGPRRCLQAVLAAAPRSWLRDGPCQLNCHVVLQPDHSLDALLHLCFGYR